MSNTSGNKAIESRDRIVRAASSLFREKGFEDAGIDQIMAAAGLSHGGFYRHFKNKAELAAATSDTMLDGLVEKWARLMGERNPPTLGPLLADYFSEGHLTDVSEGCVFAALSGDASRQDPLVKKSFSRGLRAALATLAQTLPAGRASRRRTRSMCIAAEMVGAMILARAVDDEALAREVLAAVKSDLTSRGKEAL